VSDHHHEPGPDCPNPEHHTHGARPRTSELLHDFANAGSSDKLELGELVDHFGTRAFGVLMIFAVLPSLIPTPVGAGGLSGTLIALVGVQMLFGLEHPWLPKAMRRRGLARESVARFVARMEPWLKRMEKLCRARWTVLLEKMAARFTGLLLVGHGIALALPIPFTNYPFCFVLLGVAIALLEGDGLILAIGWVLMIATIVAVGGLSGAIVQAVSAWLG
jgi:hypothetical protein